MFEKPVKLFQHIKDQLFTTSPREFSITIVCCEHSELANFLIGHDPGLARLASDLN
jgi:hypothetical protein